MVTVAGQLPRVKDRVRLALPLHLLEDVAVVLAVERMRLVDEHVINETVPAAAGEGLHGARIYHVTFFEKPSRGDGNAE